jgi:hypothetical protein
MKTPPKMKGLLYNSICRSKLLYGIESIELSKREMEKLESYEGSILKRSNDRSTALVYVMGISKLSVAILKRRLNFVTQVLTNEITNALITLSPFFHFLFFSLQ